MNKLRIPPGRLVWLAAVVVIVGLALLFGLDVVDIEKLLGIVSDATTTNPAE